MSVVIEWNDPALWDRIFRQCVGKAANKRAVGDGKANSRYHELAAVALARRDAIKNGTKKTGRRKKK